VTALVVEPLPRPNLRRSFAAVALGGAIGTLVRAELVTHYGPPKHLATDAWIGVSPSHVIGASVAGSWVQLIPWWLLVINTIGVFIAAFLLSGPLSGRSPDAPVRLFAITGILGGLTSYSSLVAQVATIKEVSLSGGIVVLVGSLVAGLAAAWLGIKAARS
jgi:fluoride ion exporter CrcB/FEX